MLTGFPHDGWRINFKGDESIKLFFQHEVGAAQGTAFLLAKPMTDMYLRAFPEVKLPAVLVYEIKAGAKNGMTFGYWLRSPLKQKLDPLYNMYYRPQFDQLEALKSSRKGMYKYSLKGGLTFHQLNDDALLIAHSPDSTLVDMLEK